MLADSPKAVHELGDASFYLYDYLFSNRIIIIGIFTLQTAKRQGYGSVYQVQPTMDYFFQLETGHLMYRWSVNTQSINLWLKFIIWNPAALP